jgi:TPR repeat protein
MLHRLLLVTILLPTLPIQSSFAQAPDDAVPLTPIESPAPPAEVLGPEHAPPDRTLLEPQDAVMVLGELRDAVRVVPGIAGNRLRLAYALYRIGDLDAAIEECRVAIRLQPDDAKAHLQLGVILTAKQDWRAAASVLKEAIRLDPQLTQAYYNLGSVQYSSGNLKAAIQSYRQALELQPYFPDARYRLALLLKLSNHEQEASQLMEAAAVGGISQAQFFLGNAYKQGQGVDKDLAKAIFWWAKAMEYGYQPANDALSRLRRQALSPDQPERKRKEMLEAFQRYREKLWDEFPDYARTDDSETLGSTLLKQHRTDYAVSTLLKECYGLSVRAQVELEKLYEIGWDQHPPPFDKTILACFETTAAEGFLPAKKSLARIYAKGLGMPPDTQKAKVMLKGLPKQETKALLDTLGVQ